MKTPLWLPPGRWTAWAVAKSAKFHTCSPITPGTRPVRHLRDSAVTMGLLRKERGRLLLTARGSAVRAHPVALWWHLAERMPVPSAVTCEVQAGLILLTCVAARFTDPLDETTGRLLAAMGWTSPGGTPLTGAAAAGAAWNTRTVLRRLGAFCDVPGRAQADRPAPDGVMFARAALLTWPGRPATGPG